MPDPAGDFVVLDRGEGLHQRLVVGHQPVDVIDVDEAVAPGARHARIDLRDHQTGVFQACPGDVHRNPQAAVAVLVRRAHLHDGGVQADAVAGKQAGDFGKVAGNVVDPAFEGRLAHGPADEEQLQRKTLQERGAVDEMGKGVGQHLVEHDVLQARVGHHGLDQVLGLPAPRADEDPAAALDFPNRILGGQNLRRVTLLPIHYVSPAMMRCR